MEFDNLVRNNNREQDLRISCIGLAGEVGEVLEPIKKFYRDHKAINQQEMLFELGDVIHYAVMIGHHFGFTLPQILKANTDKLIKRRAEHPDWNH